MTGQPTPFLRESKNTTGSEKALISEAGAFPRLGENPVDQL